VDLVEFEIADALTDDAIDPTRRKIGYPENTSTPPSSQPGFVAAAYCDCSDYEGLARILCDGIPRTPRIDLESGLACAVICI
jgi:hypothetical protein